MSFSKPSKEKKLPEERKPYTLLSRRQQLRRINNQRQQDLDSVISELQDSVQNKNSSFHQELEENLNISAENLNISAENLGPTAENLGPTAENQYDKHEDNPDLTRSNIDDTDISNNLDEEEFWEKLNLYSDDEGEEEVSKELSLWEEMAAWSLRHFQNRRSINEMLDILRRHGHSELPKDSRTLLGTPRKSSNIIDCGSGTYLHYGLERAILEVLPQMSEITDNIVIDINIDGLPLTKSSKSQLWPILGKINNHPQVFLIGAYHGYEKPKSMDDFLNSLLEEYANLRVNGINFNGKNYTIKINSIICDSPARSMITCTKSHNGYFGCPRCIDEGDYIRNRMCFMSTSSQLRSNESFVSRTNLEHHTGDSPFEKYGFDMVTQFPLDPMHLRDLGIGKRFLKLLLSGERKAGKLTGKEIENLSQILISLRPWIPCEFARKPRGVSEIDRWKATEFRLFLYYLGPLVINQVLSDAYALHFNALHAALTILSHPRNWKDNNKCADDLLKWFIETFKTLYGEHNLVYTVHCMQHLSEQVLLLGPLDNTTAYPFENFMQTIKKLIRRPTNVLAQLFRRLVEMSAETQTVTGQKKKNEVYPQLLKPMKPEARRGFTDAYEEVLLPKFKLSIKRPDNCCYLKKGKIIVIDHIACNELKYVIVGKVFKKLSGFPNYPGNSEDLDLYVAQELSETVMYPIDDIAKKAILLPCNQEFYIIPLLHSS